MPIGPQGQKRPADLVGCAVLVCKILTGQVEDPHVKPPDPTKAAAGRAGGEARAKKLGVRRRRQIAREGGKASWKNSQAVDLDVEK